MFIVFQSVTPCIEMVILNKLVVVVIIALSKKSHYFGSVSSVIGRSTMFSSMVGGRGGKLFLSSLK